MINITVGENQRFELPNKWNEITIEQYAKMVSLIKHYKLHEDTKETNIDKEQKSLNNLRCSQEIFSYLTGMKPHEVGRIDFSQMQSLIAEMSTLLQSQDVLKTDIENGTVERTDHFVHKGIKYYFPKMNLEETTFGDYIETQQLNVANAESEAGRFGVMAEQMAILCKEQGVENTPELIKKKTRLFSKLGMDIVWQFIFFLMVQPNTSTKNLALYSKMATEMETAMQQKIGTS
jgi:hypothetical protein